MSRIGKKGIRRFLPLILLAVALILAAAFVLLLPAIRERFPSEAARQYSYSPTYRTIDERDAQTLRSITISHLNGETYTLLYQDGTLALRSETGEPEPIDAALADNLIKYATTIYIEDTIAQDESEVLDSLSYMGLQPPQIEAAVAYADGSAVTISLGYSMSDTTYHYYRWSGDNAVYLCNSGVYDAFEYTSDMLFAVPRLTIVPSLIERVSIRRGDSEPIVCVFATDGEGTVQGMLQSPFVYPMDAEAVQSLLNAIKNFRLGARREPVSDETLALYGLDVPQAVVQIDQREGLYAQTDFQGALASYPLDPIIFTLTIGNAEGDFFHDCAYEGTCYRVSDFLVSAFLQADATNYATPRPADMGDEALQSVVAQTGNGTLNFRATYTEQVLPNNELETDEYGNVVVKAEAALNGEPISIEAFDALTERLRQMSVSGGLESVTKPGGTPRWQLILTTAQGRTRTLAAYPMDAFHDVLAVDGVALHYISNEALEIALGEFAALLETADTP